MNAIFDAIQVFIDQLIAVVIHDNAAGWSLIQAPGGFDEPFCDQI